MNQEPIPESRTYRHAKCNEETTVGEQSFEVMSNPLSDMSRTWCTSCDAFFPLSEYEWADTGENITDYYARHSARASGFERFLCSKKFLIISVIIGFLIGAVGGFLLFRDNDLWLKLVMTPFIGFIGVFIAAAVNVSIISKIIVRRVCGVSDTRALK